jgi:ATP-dependent Clp protease ATP-binding subunit ClpC
MEDILHERVIGQHEAVQAVARAIRRGRAGLKDPKRPIGSFIFLGPTGVGKTELARSLAEALFEDEESMIRLDMSEYMEKHTTARLIGAPPGYVGYDEGGQLTEKVRRKPYSVILLDEIEKAHPDVFNVLLQILEDGRLTDGKGRTVSFRNTVVIMTSNVGANYIKKQPSVGFRPADAEKSYESMKNRLLDELKRTFRPEFLNRVDDLIVFKSLSEEDIGQIVDLMLNDLAMRIKEYGLQIEVTPEAKRQLAREGYDPTYGARPLRRVIQKRLEDGISEEMLKGYFTAGDTIIVDKNKDEEKLVFSKKVIEQPKQQQKEQASSS